MLGLVWAYGSFDISPRPGIRVIHTRFEKKFIDTDGTLQHPIPAAAPGKWRKTNEETARWSEDRQVKGGERLSSPRTVDNSEVA